MRPERRSTDVAKRAMISRPNSDDLGSLQVSLPLNPFCATSWFRDGFRRMCGPRRLGRDLDPDDSRDITWRYQATQHPNVSKQWSDIVGITRPASQRYQPPLLDSNHPASFGGQGSAPSSAAFSAGPGADTPPNRGTPINRDCSALFSSARRAHIERYHAMRDATW
jgi:hypothetical protein